MASRDPRLLDAAAARLVAATSRGEAAPWQAIEALSTAAQAWRGLHYAAGGGSSVTAGLAESLSRLGHAQAAAGMRTAATTLRDAIAHRRRRTDPDGDEGPLARDLSMLGAVQMMIAPAEALPTLAESVELHGRLAESAPERWQGPLARGLLCLSVLLAEQARVDEARTTASDLMDVIGPDGHVDVDRDAFLRPLSELVDRVAPADAQAPAAVELRARFEALPRR